MATNFVENNLRQERLRATGPRREQLRASGMAVKQLKAELLICWNLNAAVKENDWAARTRCNLFVRTVPSCAIGRPRSRYFARPFRPDESRAKVPVLASIERSPRQ